MSLPKRHHTIPQMILRRFANERGTLHLYNRDRLDKKYYTANVKNSFVKKHLYSLLDNSGGKNPALEKKLSKLEGHANQIIQKILAAAEGNNTPNLTTEEKEIWDQFFFIQWKRVPEALLSTSTLVDFQASWSCHGLVPDT